MIKANRYYFFLVSMCLISSLAIAQNPELAKTYLDEADQVYREVKDAKEIAKEIYIQAAEADTNNVKANFMAGTLYLETVNKDYSVTYFERVKRLDPKYAFNIDYLLGRGYQYGLDFKKALGFFTQYKRHLLNNRGYRGPNKTGISEVDQRIKECENGMEIIDMPTLYTIENVGSDINSKWPDYAPVLNDDETMMIFTSRRQEDNVSADVDRDNLYFEDIFISQRKGITWEQARNIGTKINTKYHDSNLYLTRDGKTLYIYSDQGNGDIYFSEVNESGEWSRPEPIPGRVNSTGFSEQSVCISADGEFMLFATNRPGGYGGFDIYGCYKEKGQWLRPFNMGPAINTEYDEDGPFLAGDGVTLYFSSSGHKGFGGYDIFKTVYNDDSESWQRPQNLGYPVNTVDDEVYFYPTKDGKRGYLASVREEGEGYTDIYMVRYTGNLGVTARNKIAKLKEAENNFISDQDLKTKQLIDSVLNISAYQVYFDVNSAEVYPEFEKKLMDMANFVKQHQNLGIQISAFASSDGNPRYNFELSNKRAQAVMQFLREQGVEDERLAARGFGILQTIEDKSRRAEVKILDLSKL